MRDCRKDRKPPYAERHVRWCERSHGELIPMLLLDRQRKAEGQYARATVAMPENEKTQPVRQELAYEIEPSDINDKFTVKF